MIFTFCLFCEILLLEMQHFHVSSKTNIIPFHQFLISQMSNITYVLTFDSLVKDYCAKHYQCSALVHFAQTLNIKRVSEYPVDFDSGGHSCPFNGKFYISRKACMCETDLYLLPLKISFNILKLCGNKNIVELHLKDL